MCWKFFCGVIFNLFLFFFKMYILSFFCWFWIVGWIVNCVKLIMVKIVFKCINDFVLGILIVKICLIFGEWLNKFFVSCLIVCVFVCLDILIRIVFLFRINLFLFFKENGFLCFDYIGIFWLLKWGWCFKISLINIDFCFLVGWNILLIVILLLIIVVGFWVKYKFGNGFRKNGYCLFIILFKCFFLCLGIFDFFKLDISFLIIFFLLKDIK